MREINSTNKLKEMREKVRTELDHINKGSELQNMLRMLYQMQRMHSLGKKAKTESTKEDVLSLVITEMKKRYPSFEPKYDHQFFEI